MTLRTRIYAGFALVLVAFVAVSGVVVAAQRDQLVDQLDNQLAAVAPLNRGTPRPAGDAAPLEGTDVAPPDLDDAAPSDVAGSDPPISDLYIAAVAADGSLDVRVEGQLLQTTPTIDIAVAETTSGRRFDVLDSADGSTRFRALLEPVGDSGEVVVIALPMDDVDDSTRQLVVTFVLLVAFVGAVLALLAGWIARLGLRPISEMTETATAIAAGDREQRVPDLDSRTEAGQLAAAFNEMLDQRDGAEDRLRRFVSDASHELRTPLTSVRGYLDLYAEGGFRGPGQLDDAVRRMQSEANRMTGLVEDLLELARFDEQRPLQRTMVDLGAMVEGVVADSRAAHPDRTITARIASGLSAVALDRDKVQQLLVGLVDNALTHAPGAEVSVRAGRVGDRVELVVADDGPGLDQEQAERVFERFYRGDPARAHSSGGSGLGLAIAQSIAVAHGGSIDLRTSLGSGSEFTVRLQSLDGTPTDSDAAPGP